MERKNSIVLMVEDKRFNLEMIKEYLFGLDIDIECVETEGCALSALKKTPKKFSAIFLDRVTSGDDGMEVLTKIKSNGSINKIPVIMRSPAAGEKSLVEGVNAGAHYYFSKPYDQQTLASIVSTAVRDYEHYTHIQECLEQSSQKLGMMETGKFCFKSLSDGREIAALLANACPEPDNVVLGLTELMINAVEHGNLGIGYEDKTRLNAAGEWENEIERRLALPVNRNKHVTIEFNRNHKEITFLITDQGDGFDWKPYMEISPERASDSHGRGIAMAKLISFNKIEYLGSGNKVRVTLPMGG